MADLEFSVEDGIGTILLNRPQRRNAFTFDMIDQWAEIVRSVRTDDDVMVLVLTGAGKAFCAGGDLDELAEPQSALSRKRGIHERIQRIALAMEDLDKPTIAAVNGDAVGAGMDMALMCDLRVAARSARFAEAYVNVGLVPGDGGCYYLPRLVGMGRALELLLTGDMIGAEDAARMGLVNKVVDDDAVRDEARALAAKLAAKPQVALRMIKRATYQSARVDLRTALDLVSSHFGVVAVTEDATEAMTAFREKRPPVFRGR
ncbi:MAG TPA: enoyl-CoA hydratase-related protein [Acidimicrobiales bacterium]|nr:enoyl-CoA hydratase-related protein [Acidimicrobiales bacterium]